MAVDSEQWTVVRTEPAELLSNDWTLITAH